METSGKQLFESVSLRWYLQRRLLAPQTVVYTESRALSLHYGTLCHPCLKCNLIGL